MRGSGRGSFGPSQLYEESPPAWPWDLILPAMRRIAPHALLESTSVYPGSLIVGATSGRPRYWE